MSDKQTTEGDYSWPEWVKTETILQTDERGMRAMYRRWLLDKRINCLEAKLDRVLALLENQRGK